MLRTRPGGLAAGAALAVAAGLLAAFLLTPHEHVAAGCFWWTATTVGQVVPGDRGCVRGYVAAGGELAEGSAADAVRLPLAYADPDRTDFRPVCRFQAGEAVAIGYHAAFDDGRTILVVDRCPP